MIKTLQIKTERYSKSKITLRQLVNLYPKIKVDYSIQRPFRWSENRFREYFSSSLEGLGNKRLLVSDIAGCLNYSEEVSDWDSYVWFEKLLQNNFEKVSIDGNSRTTGSVKNITEGWGAQYWNNYVLKDKMGELHTFNFDLYRKFIKGKQESKLQFSLYDISSDEKILNSKIKKYTLVGGKNKKHNLENEDIEYLLRFYNHILDNTWYELYNYDSLIKPELGILFVNENQNEKIVPQDIRNAQPKPLSEIIRNMCDESTTLGKMWKSTISDATYLKRLHQELTAFGLMFLRNKSSFTNGGTKKLTQGVLTNFYKNSSDNFELTSEETKILNLIPSSVKCDGEYQSQVFKEKGKFFDHLAICEGIVKNNCSITTIDWKIIREKINKWFTEKNKRTDYKVSSDKTGNFSSYRGTIKKFPSEGWYGDIQDNLIPKLIDEGILIKREERISFDKWVYALKYYEQKGICSLTGRKIPESEIYDGSKWVIDHKVPLDGGGTNDLDNLYLAEFSANSSKGSKLNYKMATV